VNGVRAPVLILALLCASGTLAHDPISTKLLWTQDISRLVYQHCAVCHREGGAAPMSLMTYEEARPWAKAIRDEVLSRRMPPWGAVKGVGQFRDDPSMSQIEIDMIVNWVEGGAPEGDDAYLPPAPRFSGQSKPISAEREVAVTTNAAVVLSVPTELEGIRPAQLAAGESLDIAACQPNGAVQHLIWLRNWRPEWQRTYYFLHSIALPKGTRIIAWSAKPATAEIVIAAPSPGS
jgi:hypothetical protein